MRASITNHHGNFFFDTSEYVRITGWYFVTYTVSPLHSAFTRMVSFTRINLTFNLSLDMKTVSKFTLKKVSFVIFLTKKVSTVLTNVVSFRCTYGNLSTNRWCLATGSHENRMKNKEKSICFIFSIFDSSYNRCPRLVFLKWEKRLQDLFYSKSFACSINKILKNNSLPFFRLVFIFQL